MSRLNIKVKIGGNNMPVCALDNYKQCEDFGYCRRYCGYKAGESLALMVLNMPVVETKIGLPLASSNHDKYNKFKYCGISVDKYSISTSSGHSSHADIAMDAEKFKPFGNPFKSCNELTASSAMEKYLSIEFPSASGYKTLMDRYYSLVSGRMVPMIIPPEEEITMKFRLDEKERQEIGRVSSIVWKPDKETGEIRCFISGETKASGMNVTVVYSPEDFSNRVFVNKYKLGMKYTMSDDGIIKMNNSGYISPIEIYDGKVRMYLDGHNLILRSNNNIEVIIGSFTLNGEFKEYPAPGEVFKTSASYKLAKQIIPFIAKFRWFIIPHGMCDDFAIDAHKYLIDAKKSSK